MFCRISHHHSNVETTEDFVALCIIILIMAAIAALMDFLRKPKKSESADIEISIKITLSEENKIREKSLTNGQVHERAAAQMHEQDQR